MDHPILSEGVFFVDIPVIAVVICSEVRLSSVSLVNVPSLCIRLTEELGSSSFEVVRLSHC